MNKTVAVLAFLLPSAVLAQKSFDPSKDLSKLGKLIDNAWTRDAATKVWVLTDMATDKCQDVIDTLAKKNVAGSAKLVLNNDTPELLRGEHTLDEVRPLCTKIVHNSKVKKWEKWAWLSVEESGKIGGRKFYDTAIFEKCVKGYDDLVKDGVPATTKVRDKKIKGPDGGQMIWSGTIEDLRKKWCDVGLKQVQTEIDAKQAPYKKVLKSDKLSMALSTGTFYLPGGTTTSDPKKLADATVWFSDTVSVNSGRATCNGGAEIHVVHRYQFDATHKLVKTTDKEYCGAVPKNAYN
jgi:hypothetical protein